MRKLMIGVLLLCGLMVGCHSNKSKTVNNDIDKNPVTGRPAVATESGNLLANPGFEDGLSGWKWLDWSKNWSSYKLSTDHAYEGRNSLHLPVFSANKRPATVWGGVQELELDDEIPECIEGYYYVSNWSKSGDWEQYLQFVIIDMNHSLGKDKGSAQLRYIISGAKEPPLRISNAKYLFVENPRRETPVLGKWTHFSLNPRRDFVKKWKYAPKAGSKLRLLFEARYDKHESAQPAQADVYYDRLYFGPKTANHCADLVDTKD